MTEIDIPGELRKLAEIELEKIKNFLPTTVEEKFLLLLEIQRMFDVHAMNRYSSNQAEQDIAGFDVLKWGTNLALENLLVAQAVKGALPMMESTPELRTVAVDLLRGFGVVALTRRAAEMIEHGFLVPFPDGAKLTLKDSGRGPIQFMDQMEHDFLSVAESNSEKNEISPQGWTLMDKLSEENVKEVGAFWLRPERKSERVFTSEALDEAMLPLIKPWVTPYGIMIGYGGRPDVDAHFLREVIKPLKDYQAGSGIRPESEFGGFTGADLLGVVGVLLMILRKHVSFVALAHEKVPEICTRQSLTLWEPKEELVSAIHEFTRIPRRNVRAVLDALTVTPNDIHKLAEDSTPLMPLLIDLGNGMYLRPISSLIRNPLFVFHTIAGWRNPATQNIISASREAWMRAEIYSLFRGVRYTCVEGNITLRKGGKRLTDIDAVVFDRTTGELALIQIKWQDYSTSDIRKLKSKARNFSTEVDNWAANVTTWMSETPPDELMKALRLKIKGAHKVGAVFLFVLSRHVSRTHGYGHPVLSPYLSLASWPQFTRLRLQIGPAPRVISKLHELMRNEENLVLAKVEPIPLTIKIQGLTITFADLWNKWDDASRPKTD